MRPASRSGGGSLGQRGGDLAGDLGVLEHRHMAAVDREDPASAGGQEADFVFGQPAHDHVLAAVYVEHPAQIGAGEAFRVAVVAGGSP